MRTRSVNSIMQRVAAKIINAYAAPSLSHSEELLEGLREAAERERVAGEWAKYALEIESAVRRNGADEFLRLPMIGYTMHQAMRSLVPKYLAYIFQSKSFSAEIQKALTESPVGKPILSPRYPLSSPTLIQHGYHFVRLLESTDFDLSAMRLIVEFGGGYGSFFRLLRNLGYRNRYVICDLPAMCALQRFYLRNVFPSDPGASPPANLRWLSGDMKEALKREVAECGPSLFMATWSLSESPFSVRDSVVSAMGEFKYILCAYQRRFGSYDNVEYFSSMQKMLPQFDWQHAACPVYKDSFYMIGRNTAVAGNC